ncbi:MAG: translation initiation factor IF-6 [Candidatus Hydrothermarchaeales archaeon]
MIRLSSYRRNPSVGVFARACDRMAFVPSFAPADFVKDIKEALEVEVFPTEVAEISLLGAMMTLNNNGILLPRNTTEKELEFFQSLDTKVGVIDDKPTALGNLVTANDNGAVVSTLFSAAVRKEIGDILDVEVVARDFQGYRTVGSIGVATSKGALMHPVLTENDLESIEKLLKVEVDIGTVNRGVGYVRTGIVANSKGAVIGKDTTSPEIARIEDALALL